MVAFGILAILLFGSKLPEVARKLGGSYRDFRKSIGDFQREFQNWDRDPPPKPVQRSHEEQSPSAITSTPKFTPPPQENE